MKVLSQICSPAMTIHTKYLILIICSALAISGKSIRTSPLSYLSIICKVLNGFSNILIYVYFNLLFLLFHWGISIIIIIKLIKCEWENDHIVSFSPIISCRKEAGNQRFCRTFTKEGEHDEKSPDVKGGVELIISQLSCKVFNALLPAVMLLCILYTSICKVKVWSHFIPFPTTLHFKLIVTRTLFLST